MTVPNVTHDWGVLKETVVGRVIDFTFPAELAAGVPASLGFLPERTRQNMPRWAGKLWSQADPEGYERCVEQVEGLAGFLTARGVGVHRPRALTDSELNLYGGGFSMQTFVRDPMIVIGDRVIEAALRLPARFKERFGVRPVIEEAEGRGARCSVMPPPAPVPWRTFPRPGAPSWRVATCSPWGATSSSAPAQPRPTRREPSGWKGCSVTAVASTKCPSPTG
ncbi:hypothetical protein AB0E82_33670 [Streptomyces anulatus]|uniref:hypothetical protein n=1 Tax=Streptomyces anulatus TaxID=1892 RepID=UPI0033E0F0D3